MSHADYELYEFGEFTLDPRMRVLHRQGALVALPPKAFELLLALVESHGTPLDKDALMARVWPGTFVEEGNLPVNVHALRKALGDSGETFIKTLPRRGYCFVAPVSRVRHRGASVSAERFEATNIPAVAARSSPRWLWGTAAMLAIATAVALLDYLRPPATLPLLQVRSIAILPLISNAGDELSYVGPGLAGSIASTLSGLPEVIVRPFASSAKYIGPSQDAVEAGRALQVDAVLTGSARKLGSTWDVSAALVSVADGARIWSFASTGSTGGLAPIERQLVDRLAHDLEPGLSATDRAALAGPRTTHDAAYHAYLRGRDESSRLNGRDAARAAESFAAAIAADPAFAEAHAGLAAQLVLTPANALTASAIARAHQSATTALGVNDRLADAHSALGRARLLEDWDWNAAGREFERGIAVAPYNPEPHFWRALHLSALQRHDEALGEIRLAQDLDPTSARINLYVGVLLIGARRYDEAIAQLRKTPLEMGLFNQQLYYASAVAEAKRARWDDALEVLQRLARNDVGAARAYIAYVEAEAGRLEESRRLLDAMAAQPETNRTPHVVLAAAEGCAGRPERAFARIDRAYAVRDPRLVFLHSDPMFDCLRGDRRFASALARLNLPVADGLASR